MTLAEKIAAIIYARLDKIPGASVAAGLDIASLVETAISTERAFCATVAFDAAEPYGFDCQQAVYKAITSRKELW